MAVGTQLAAARERSGGIKFRTSVNLEKHFDRLNVLPVKLRDRMRMATQHLKDRVVQNISRPVTKTVVIRTHDTSQRWMGRDTKFGGPVGSQYMQVTERSPPGEFPKADTTLLMTSIFDDQTEPEPGVVEGYVGHPLSYGLSLELKMDRLLLVRTLLDELPNLRRFFEGPLA